MMILTFIDMVVLANITKNYDIYKKLWNNDTYKVNFKVMFYKL